MYPGVSGVTGTAHSRMIQAQSRIIRERRVIQEPIWPARRAGDWPRLTIQEP
jgi:hypothetical protein